MHIYFFFLVLANEPLHVYSGYNEVVEIFVDVKIVNIVARAYPVFETDSGVSRDGRIPVVCLNVGGRNHDARICNGVVIRAIGGIERGIAPPRLDAGVYVPLRRTCGAVVFPRVG